MSPNPILRDDHEVCERLVRIEEQVKSLQVSLDQAILTQLKDHGKRLAALERLEQRRMGGRLALAATVSVCSSLVGVVAAVVIKMWG